MLLACQLGHVKGARRLSLLGARGQRQRVALGLGLWLAVALFLVLAVLVIVLCHELLAVVVAVAPAALVLGACAGCAQCTLRLRLKYCRPGVSVN